MKETRLFSILRPHLASWGEYDRLENAIGSGMSDVYYNIGGRTGWIETKIAKAGKIYFEKFQPQWIGKHHRQGAKVCVVVMDSAETIHFYNAGVILKAPRTPIGKWTTVDMQDLPVTFNMPKPYRSWKSVREILTS